MKKILFISLCSIMSFGAYAADMPTPPTGGGHGGHGPMNMFANLTDEQKSCIEAYGCKMPEKPAMDENQSRPEPKNMADGRPDKKPDNAPEKPDDEKSNMKGSNPPEMGTEQKESMDCMRKAMESCGIEMPQRPEKPSGERFDEQRTSDRKVGTR